MTLEQMINAILLYREVTINGHRITERRGVYMMLDTRGVVIMRGTAKEVYTRACAQ
ncbi:MAG: hypothetical protein ACXWP0_01280 [Ktedonobacterales bacterium]